MNAGDVDGVLDLFSDDVVFEDPVGTPRSSERRIFAAVSRGP